MHSAARNQQLLNLARTYTHHRKLWIGAVTGRWVRGVQPPPGVLEVGLGMGLGLSVGCWGWV